MKNEFGHIIKKKVENSSMTPPPMDWGALSDAQKATPKTTKSFITSKLGLVISGFVSIAVITVIASLFLSSPDSKNQPKPAVLKEESDPINENVQPEILDTVIIPIKEEKKISATLKKKKKKDKFIPLLKKNKLNSAENKDTEQSTTTILYEVDTVTTETYIYE